MAGDTPGGAGTLSVTLVSPELQLTPGSPYELPREVGNGFVYFHKKNGNSTGTPGYLHIGIIKTCAIDFP